MEKKIKTKAGYDVVSFRIHRSGKGQPFNFKPDVCPQWDSLHFITYDTGSIYKTTSYYVPLMVQFFWLGLIFTITIHKRKLGSNRIVLYQDTHLSAIDKVLKSEEP